MAEAVRLVIWDLDETFWQGTLSEGGHRYNQSAHDIVIALARRGIMSSICSKNDFAPVRAILEETGIWEYFIFPSIDWEPKGPRIQALIEAVQLRPESVLFIDDNSMNLNEALHFVPGLQTADENFIPTMLDSPLFRGKDDTGLSRLQQYKLMERRHADETVATAQAGGSNVDFLRGSNIRVRIERDVVRHIDRAVELINRTNQLNFTKSRLPEDPAEARAALMQLLQSHVVQAGLVEVFDNYGNYGFCGFYLTKTGADRSTLLHYCFSCRILNMGVEVWLYQALGRPALRTRGTPPSDPITAPPVDWITAITEEKDGAAVAVTPQGPLSTVSARGGCVLMPLIHYFTMTASSVVGEYNTMREGISVRLDHSLCFRHAVEGLSAEAMASIEPLGFQAKDFESRFFEHDGPEPLWVFSNWADLGLPIYQHRRTKIRIPYRPAPAHRHKSEAVARAQAYLEKNFIFDDYLGEWEMKENLRMVFSRVPSHGKMFVPLALDSFLENGIRKDIRPRILQNRWTTEVAREFPTVHVLEMADFVQNDDEVKDKRSVGHFDRMVYFRLYQEIARLAGLGVAAQQAA